MKTTVTLMKSKVTNAYANYTLLEWLQTGSRVECGTTLQCHRPKTRSCILNPANLLAGEWLLLLLLLLYVARYSHAASNGTLSYCMNREGVG